MSAIGRVLGLLITTIVGTAVAAAVAARVARDRMIRSEDPEADEVAVAAIFEPLDFRSEAHAFRGGKLECWYGGGVFDLRDATLDPGGATLRVKAIFGGGQILVPDHWQVETRVVGLGGIGDTREKRARAADAPRLTIEGLAIFGGFGISSKLPDGANYPVKRSRNEPGAEMHREESELPERVAVTVG